LFGLVSDRTSIRRDYPYQRPFLGRFTLPRTDGPGMSHGCNLWRQTIQDRNPRLRPHIEPGLGSGQTDEDWATALEAALTAMRRDDLQHGTTLLTWPAVSAEIAESVSAADGEES
jgi:hypothetical protein